MANPFDDGESTRKFDDLWESESSAAESALLEDPGSGTQGQTTTSKKWGVSVRKTTTGSMKKWARLSTKEKKQETNPPKLQRSSSGSTSESTCQMSQGFSDDNSLLSMSVSSLLSAETNVLLAASYGASPKREVLCKQSKSKLPSRKPRQTWAEI